MVPPARRMPPHRIRGRRSESPGEDEIVRHFGLGRNTPTGLTELPVFWIRTVLGPDPNRGIRPTIMNFDPTIPVPTLNFESVTK